LRAISWWGRGIPSFYNNLLVVRHRVATRAGHAGTPAIVMKLRLVLVEFTAVRPCISSIRPWLCANARAVKEVAVP
jgi:hypothetical protein